MYGYSGKILQVNLTTEKTKILEPKLALLKSFLGGSGLAAKLLYDNLEAETDAYAKENWVIFMTGPVAGTMVPTGSRHALVSKSPLTGLLIETWAGSSYGNEMKSAGYDGFMIVGKSEKPTYLFVEDDSAEFRDAQGLWGKTTYETDDLIREELRNEDINIACIGPAGEHLVRFACVMNNCYSASGRGGIGAVFGSKNLKAVAVYGTGNVEVANMDELLEVVNESYERIKQNYVSGKAFPLNGTLGNVDPVNEAGIFPTRNFRSGVFEQIEKITAANIRGKYLFKDASCYTCPVACQKRTKVEGGKHSGVITEGPEYETLWAFSANCGNSDVESVIKANDLCNLYGLDTMSAGGVIGFAMECFEKKVLAKEDLDGQNLSFGNPDAIIESLNRIAYRKGYGNFLAEGVKRVAEKLGPTDYAMHVKGLELAGYDPRGAVGMGLAYATANRGGCHNRGWVVGMELYGGMDRFTTEKKAELCKSMQDYGSVKDSLIMCHFVFSPNDPALDLNWVTRMMRPLTGFDFTEKDLLTVGERIWNLVRAFNVKAGVSRKDDRLPKRLLEEPIPYGPSRGHVVKLEDMLEEYYRLRKWDNAGVPSEIKLRELGLGDVADDLKEKKKKDEGLHYA